MGVCVWGRGLKTNRSVTDPGSILLWVCALTGEFTSWMGFNGLNAEKNFVKKSKHGHMIMLERNHDAHVFSRRSYCKF